MAYGRKYTKKPTMAKRTYAKKTSSSFAKKVRAVVNKVAETKTHITVLTESLMSSASSPATVTTLNAIASGGGAYQRVGNKINPTFLNVRGSAHVDPGVTSQFVRILILECDVGDDALTDLMETDTATYAPASGDLSAMYGRVNPTRYKTLVSKVLKVGRDHGFNGAQLFNFNIKLKGSMYFEQGSGTTPQKRKIVLLAFNRRTDNDEITGSSAELTINSKFYFTDM